METVKYKRVIGGRSWLTSSEDSFPFRFDVLFSEDWVADCCATNGLLIVPALYFDW